MLMVTLMIVGVAFDGVLPDWARFFRLESMELTVWTYTQYSAGHSSPSWFEVGMGWDAVGARRDLEVKSKISEILRWVLFLSYYHRNISSVGI